MEIVTVRAGGADLEPILQDYRRRYDLGEAAVLNVLLDALSSRRAQALVALRSGRPVGAIVVSQRGAEGQIRFWHVLEGETVALEPLLRRAEEVVSRAGARRVGGTLVFPPGDPLEQALRRHGYRLAARARMVLDLGAGPPPPLWPPAYRLSPWMDTYEAAAVELLARAHQDSADAALYPELAGPEGPRRLLERVRAGMYGRFDPALAPIALAGAELAGLCLNVWHAALPGQGFILDLAVAPARRRRGLGKALVVASAQAFHRAGAQALGLAVTLANRPAVALYEELGFQVEQHFSLLHKELATVRIEDRRAQEEPAAAAD